MPHLFFPLRHYLLELLVALWVKLIPVRFDLIDRLDRSFEDVHFKDTSPSRAIWEDHDSDAFLDALVPGPHVCASVGPAHHAVALSLILDITPHVDVTRLPLKSAVAVLFIIHILAFIRIAPHSAIFISLSLLPLAMTILHSPFELASVATAIDPLVLTEALRLSVNILAHEDVAIGKEIASIPVSKGSYPLSFVFVSVAPDMDSVALGLGVLPLTDVALAVEALPHSIAALHALHPLAVIHLSILPCVYALPGGLAALIGTLIRVTV